MEMRKNFRAAAADSNSFSGRLVLNLKKEFGRCPEDGNAQKGRVWETGIVGAFAARRPPPRTRTAATR